MRAILLWSFPILAFVMIVASDAVLKAKEPDAQSSRALIDRDKRTGAELLAIPLAFIAVTSTIAAVFSVANFVYSVVQGHKQMKELKEIRKKLDEVEDLINRRFSEISQELDEIKLIAVYGRSIRRLKFFLHQQKIDIRFNSSGALINSKAATKWAKAVLSYSDDGMRQVLLDFHHMILGESHVFHGKSSVLLLRDKLRGKPGAMCEELKRYLAYLLCLQTSGHAAKAIAHLVLEHNPAKAEQALQLLEERIEEQSEFLESHGVLPFYIDGVMTWQDGRTYFFKGNNYWRYNDAEGKCDTGYPKPIREGWGGMHGPIDAVFLGNVKNSYGTYFFKGSSYYQYRKEHGQVSNPQPIENWGGLDGPIDGVFIWRNGVTYAFAEDSYYRLESGTFTGPFPISKWGGMTGPINTVFRYKKDDSTYFFKEWKYYKFEDKGDKRLSVSGPWELDYKWRGLC